MSEKIKSKRIIVRKVIAALSVAAILGIGLSMILSKIGMLATQELHYAQINGKVQTVTIEIKPKKYAPIVVQRGIPVHFIIKAASADLNACNKVLTIPKYDIEKELKPGNNRIEFTPVEAGDIAYSCKMGMVKSKIKVVEDITKEKVPTMNRN